MRLRHQRTQRKDYSLQLIEILINPTKMLVKLLIVAIYFISGEANCNLCLERSIYVWGVDIKGKMVRNTLQSCNNAICTVMAIAEVTWAILQPANDTQPIADILYNNNNCMDWIKIFP